MKNAEHVPGQKPVKLTFKPADVLKI
jgi:hypothetical protein